MKLCDMLKMLYLGAVHKRRP